MAKLSKEKTFAVFVIFQPIAKVFPFNHLLCTVHNGMDLMHRESFPVNSVFCPLPRKFSLSKVLSYTVFINQYFCHSTKRQLPDHRLHTSYGYVTHKYHSLHASFGPYITSANHSIQRILHKHIAYVTFITRKS